MKTTEIKTNAGTLELVPATTDQLRGIARHWPMELIKMPDMPGHFGLVFQHGEQEVHGVKMQPADALEAGAMVLHLVNRIRIASALRLYLAEEHKGVMVPCAYYKPKAPGKAEAGVAFFVGPDAESRSRTQGRLSYDAELGMGATAMISDMMDALSTVGTELGLAVGPLIGIDVRPRLALGALSMDFIVEGPRVFVVNSRLQEHDPVWPPLIRAGFSRVLWAPMVPAGFAADPKQMERQ